MQRASHRRDHPPCGGVEGGDFSAHLVQNERQLPGESTPEDLVALAKRFSEVPIICGHTGGTWELGIRAHTHLYADLAGSDPTSGITEMAVRELGASRVIYGSDCGGRSFASQLAKVHGAKISDADKQKIFCDNLRGLMLPILKAKGIQA